MKKILYTLLLAFISLVKITSAQTVYVNVADWGVANANLLDGKIKYESDSGETPFSTVVTFRRFDGSTPVKVQAIYVFSANGSETAISDSILVNTSDFTQSTGTYFSKEFFKTATLQPNNKNGIVKLKWRYLDTYTGTNTRWSSYQYASKTYQTVMNGGNNPTIPPYDPRAVSIYIYNSKKFGDHYLTPENKPAIGSDGSYLNEGVAFYAYSTQVAASVPIYVYNSQKYGDHYYATGNSPSIGDGNYLNEGIAFYAFSTQVVGSVPVYVYNSQKYGDHYWSTGNTPTTGADGSYKNEGIVFYAYPAR